MIIGLKQYHFSQMIQVSRCYYSLLVMIMLYVARGQQWFVSRNWCITVTVHNLAKDAF